MARNPKREIPPELGVSWRPAWRLGDPQIEADARAFWARLGALPEGVDPDLRADELVCLAYAGGEVIAAATAFVRPIEFLRAKFAMFRCSVDPHRRMHNVAVVCTGVAREILEAWAAAHPEEEVKGMATILQNQDMLAQSRGAIWRTSGLTLVGYTAADEQIRVAWFEGVRV